MSMLQRKLADAVVGLRSAKNKSGECSFIINQRQRRRFINFATLMIVREDVNRIYDRQRRR